MKIPGFVLWLLLAVAAVAVPLACSSSSSSTDGPADRLPSEMTGAG